MVEITAPRIEGAIKVRNGRKMGFAEVGVLGGVAPARGEDAVEGGLVGFADRFAPLLPVFRRPLGAMFTGLVQALRPIGTQALNLYARFSPPGDQVVFAMPEIQAMFLD